GLVMMCLIYVTGQHVILQAKRFGLFSIFFFVIQIASFVAYPEQAAQPAALFSSSNFMSFIHGCPFPRTSLGEMLTTVGTVFLLYILLGVLALIHWLILRGLLCFTSWWKARKFVKV